MISRIARVATRESRVLLGKEVRQMLRNRGALLTGLLTPIALLLLAPLQLILSAGQATPTARFEISHLELPLFTVICGLLVPSLAAVYTFVNERERRSLELLLAAPVRVQDIFVAKLAAAFLLAAGITVPLYVVQSGLVLMKGVDDIHGVLLRLVLLLATLGCSLGYALLMALLARDFRTTNNLTAALMLPMVLLTLTLLQTSQLTVLGRSWAIPVALDDRPLLVAAIMVAVGIGAAAAALRHVTFERYLA